MLGILSTTVFTTLKSRMSVTVRLEPVPAEPKASHGVSLGGASDIVVGLNTISG